MVSPPIFVDESFRHINAASIESAKNPSYKEQIELALLYERRRDFVELINNSPSHLLDENLYWIHALMFMWDSGKCVAAVLDGQTKLTQIPLAMSWFSLFDNDPLLQAAADNATKITALLLQRGFSADVRGDLDGRLENKLLPLHAILNRLRTLVLLFLPKEKLSATVLVVKLCQLEIRRSLETIRLLALNTREVKREFYNYIKEGKMIEVGALLLVAKSQILSPSTSAVNKEFREFESISEMYDFVLNAKCLKINNNKLFEMEETLVLLRIIDKIGNKLATLLRHEFVPIHMGDCSALLVESLLEDAGFDPKNVDYNHPFPRSEVVSYFSKRAIDDCENTIRTSEMLPSWLKEAVWRGLGDKFSITCRLTYPVLAASPMPQNMRPLHHLLKTTAPFLGTIKKVFRRG
ncbi:uncharacterized protein LOC141644077 isoform X1 [Silene latifolia]|uniref:uncharacterized protein LOC141644077 isoform X1 n=1 Tax=Silene latifolia TaxID=37657 RepID=UPI003D77C3FF